MKSNYGMWALVTGASSGIGQAFCRELAAKGYNLIITARRAQHLVSLQDELQGKHPVQVEVCPADMATEQGQKALIEACKRVELGLVVSNAGFGYKGLFEEQALDQLEGILQVNALAPTRLLHALLPSLKTREQAGVIITGSIEGEAGFPYSAVYAASKAYIHALGTSLWYEARNSDNRLDVLVLSPGSTDTDAPILQGISRDQLMGIMQPETVARQALSRLGKQPLFIPGIHNRFFVGLLRHLPRRVALILSGWGIKNAIEKSKPQSLLKSSKQ